MIFLGKRSSDHPSAKKLPQEMPLIQKLIVVPEFLIDSLLLGHKDVGRSQIQEPVVLVVVAVGSFQMNNIQVDGFLNGKLLIVVA